MAAWAGGRWLVRAGIQATGMRPVVKLGTDRHANTNKGHSPLSLVIHPSCSLARRCHHSLTSAEHARSPPHNADRSFRYSAQLERRSSMETGYTAIAGSSSSIPQCCCGSRDCAFLAHSGKLLEGLERDVSRAAQLGQVRTHPSTMVDAMVDAMVEPTVSTAGPALSFASQGQPEKQTPVHAGTVVHCDEAPCLTFALQALLVRHETFVADSEREREHMLSTIETLEQEKLSLEARNAQTIKENRELLDRLEQLHEAVASSDTHIQALTDTLHSTEEEIQRLSLLAARTQSLERQLLDLEREQSQLQSSLDLKTGDEKTAVQRWRRAETTIANLQDQIDRIEKESREERDRHDEVVARMERRMAVEGELATAAGRLKAKPGHDKSGTSVVSHFVKDILLDNANLQHGILELREMLLNSNEEVERLRDQLRVHQPVTTPSEEFAGPDIATPTLQKELGGESIFNQELHIHHHYHGATATPTTPKAQAHRRSKKKRFSLTPGHFTPPVQANTSTQAAIMSQTAVTIPNTNRWSNATTLAPSLPSSPQSMSHRGSIHDRVFSDVQDDSSRPTSPSDSVDLQSPMFAPSKPFAPNDAFLHRRGKSQTLKPPSLATIRSASTPISITTKSSPATAIISAVSPANSLVNDIFTLSPAIHPQSAIPEETEDTLLFDASPGPNSLASPDEEDVDEDLLSPMTQVRPTLRRAASHESLISISGMDVHTLRSRPSQLLLPSSHRFGTPRDANSIQPELTPWTATATTSISRCNLDSSTLNRSLLYSTISTPQKRQPIGSHSTPRSRQTSGLSTKLGGWVFGKWGATPTPSRTSHMPADLHTSIANSSSPRPRSSVSAETQSSTDTMKKVLKSAKEDKTEDKFKLRPAGVNQSGPIWGFFDIPETAVKVHVEEFDADALGEALAEM